MVALVGLTALTSAPNPRQSQTPTLPPMPFDKSIQISMTQSGDPLENALAERVNGILKDELLETRYQNFHEAKKAVSIAISIYNHQRPHSSIEYLTPVVAHQRTGELKKYWKNYYVITKRKEVAMT